MMTLLIFIAVLAVLVLSHEFGHFIVARKNGMRVDEFGFGFPPRICGVRRIVKDGKTTWQWVWGHPKSESESAEVLPTLYSFNLVPLGGFVKIKGENESEDQAPDSDSFASKKLWQKALVLVAGVAMNVVVAFVLLSWGYMIGMPEVDGDGAAKLENTSLQIIDVLPGKPAEKAGLTPGDIIIKVDAVENPSLKTFQDYVATHGQSEVRLTVKHEGVEVTKLIKPETIAETGKSGIGVGLAAIGVAKYPWYKALWYGFLSTGYYLKAIVVSLLGMFASLFAGKGVGGAVSGPVGVAVMTGEVARLGFIYLLQFTAMLSLNLAVLNILPIPALDGGRLFLIVLKRIFKRPITARVEQTAHMVGFLLLMLLVVVVTVKDLGTFGPGIVAWFKQLI